MGGDFNQMYQSGLDLWAGRYSGLYPLPANGLFALLALLPRPVALALLTMVGLALFVAAFRRQALIWIFFQPVLAGLWLGQCDLLFLWLLRWGSPVALALMTLKPQLFPLAIPALLAPSGRAKWKPFARACLWLYGPITIVYPTWMMEWLRQCDDGRLGWTGSSSILSNPLVGFAALLVTSALIRLDWRAVFWSVNPTIRWYDFSLMAGGSRWLIPVSWAVWGATQLVAGNPSPVAWLGVVDLATRRGYMGRVFRVAKRNICGGHHRYFPRSSE